MNDQQILPLPAPATYGPDYIIGESNRDSVGLLLGEQLLAEPVLYLYGEPGCGKSMLATLWAQRHQADTLQLPLAQEVLTTFESGRYVLDPLVLGEATERPLFHLLNLIRQTSSQLLICAREAPHQLLVRLPDLASRLRAAHALPITAPDDAMLEALFIQHFASRQLRVAPHVIQYLIRRMPRSFHAAHALAAGMDHYSITHQHPITLATARHVLQDYERRPDDLA